MLNRLRVTWNGLGGLPGLSTFYLRDEETDVSAVKTFFTSIKDNFPSALSWDIPNGGDVIDTATGALTGGWTGTNGGTVAATGGSGTFASGVGARVQWTTSTVINGRRVRGSTFLVPLLGACYSSSGDLAATQRGVMQSAATALAASDLTVVWHRPDAGASNGSLVDITGAVVPTRVTTLRSRRY